MATYSRNLVGPHRFGLEPMIKEYAPASGQTYQTDDPLALTNGQLNALTTGAQAASVKLLGFAASDAQLASTDLATGTITTQNLPTTKVLVINDECELLLPVTNGGASATTAVTDIGVQYGLFWDATKGVLSINKGDTTNLKVVVTAIGGSYPVGDAYGQAWCKLLSTARAF